MIDLLPKTQLPAMITDNKQFTLYLLRQQDLVTKKPKAGNQKHSCDDELQQTDQAANHIGEYGRSGIDMTREHHRINISHLLQCPTHGSNYRMVGLDWAKIRVRDTRMIHNRNLNCIYPRLTCPHCSTDSRFLTLFEDKYYELMKNDQIQWDNDLVLLFCVLLGHQYHHADVWFVASDISEKCGYLGEINNAEVCCKAQSKNGTSIIPADVRRLVTVAKETGHFAVLIFDLGTKTVLVRDGLNTVILLGQIILPTSLPNIICVLTTSFGQ
jgi:hypothetical protein